jgi:hypothetical protein
MCSDDIINMGDGHLIYMIYNKYNLRYNENLVWCQNVFDFLFVLALIVGKKDGQVHKSRYDMI